MSKITNWYAVAEKEGLAKKIKRDKTYANHRIEPNSQIIVIGATNSGKSNSVLDFLSRKLNSFYRVIVFNDFSTDEAINRLLSKRMEGVEMIDDPDKLPDLKDIVVDNEEKFICFDDIINSSKKTKLKIQKWINSCRKNNFTSMTLAQSFSDCPLQIRNNAMYIILFKVPNVDALKTILRKINIVNISPERFINIYNYCTNELGSFLVCYLRARDQMDALRKNWTETIDPNDKKFDIKENDDII